MNGKALGMIETVGLVPAIEAGDVALKTADVTLLGSEAVGGGLVSILVTGDVSAVKAAIDAASAAAERLGPVRSVTVISRTADGLDDLLIEKAQPPVSSEETQVAVEAASETLPAAEVVEVPASQEEGTSNTHGSEPQTGDLLSFDLQELKKLKVVKLRRLARQLTGFAIAGSEIKFAKKQDLLEAFATYMKTLEK